MSNISIEKIDREVESLLSNYESIRQVLKKLSQYVIDLISVLYGDDVDRCVKYLFEDISKSREYILATYLCIALLISNHRIDIEDIPEDVARDLVSKLLILYEKIKHIRKLLKN